MAKPRNAKSEWVLFNVLYEDGTQTSNRRVPSIELGGLDGDKPARSIIEAQDRKVAEASGVSRGRIKTVARTHAVPGAARKVYNA